MSVKDLGIRNVYLDQNVYGRMLDEAADWRESSFGKVLIDAQQTRVAQVWAGPTNVIETIQTEDPSRRRAIAATMLELIDVKRMWYGHEFEAINDFFGFLRAFAPNAIRFPDYFEHHSLVARQTWLGILGLAASVRDQHFGPVVEDLKHTKACNRLLHARFALAPEEWVQDMVDAAEALKTVAEDPLASMTRLTIEQIDAEISELVNNAQKLSKHSSAMLDKKRNLIARAYGGIEIGSILQSVFRLPLELALTFDIPHIVAAWPQIQLATNCEALPSNIRAAEPSALSSDEIAHIVIAHAIRAAARKGLMTTVLGVQVIVREMQRCMNAVALPTGGLTFDADHAAALIRHHAVVTLDEWLANSLNAMAKKLEELTGNKWKPEIVTTASQLRRVLAKPL